MKACDISKEIYNWLREKDHKGKIHSIFKSTINILSDDGKFIPIIVHDKPMSPSSIRLEEKVNFENLNVAIGDIGTFTKDLFTSRNIKVDYSNALIWDESIKLVSPTVSLENTTKKLEEIKLFILSKGNKNGIFKFLKYISKEFADLGTSYKLDDKDINDKAELFIRDRFINFIEAFKNHDITNINTLAKKIIGFGPGLTPSMDDFLSGMMVANLYISYAVGLDIEKAYNINFKIVESIENKTTLVSEEMLKQSSKGQANEDIRDLMLAITSNLKEKDLEDLMERVIDFGHSSGTDILCGIYIGSRIVLDKL